MPAAHRQDDTRACGATTQVVGQSTVYIEGKLWAVKDDINTHGDGKLNPSGSTITIDGKAIVVVGDTASQDNLCPVAGGNHCLPAATSGSGTVSCY